MFVAGELQLTQIATDFRDGGGYYIDVGCSRLIADGKIKIKQGVEIEKLTKDGILFKDGVELKADISKLSSFAGLLFYLELTPLSLRSHPGVC